LPAQGYVGFVNLRENNGGVQFTVRSEPSGDHATYTIPKDKAVTLLTPRLSWVWAAETCVLVGG